MATPPPSPLLNPLLYPGTLRPAASCPSPKSCTDFVITFTNTDKVTLNSFMFGIAGNPLKSFELAGEPACKPNGSRFGPTFADGWLCLGLHVAPEGTFTGSGVATHPLTPATVARFDESNKGSTAGLLPDISQDIHFYPVAAAATAPSKSKHWLARAGNDVVAAIADEKRALGSDGKARDLDADVEKGLRSIDDAMSDLKDAGLEDEISGSAEASIAHTLGDARSDDEDATETNSVTAAKTSVREALAKKQAALRLIDAALKD
jgi:hypothetical protein